MSPAAGVPEDERSCFRCGCRRVHPGARGGKPRPPVPYTKDLLGDDFRTARQAVFPGDKRQVQDFRRSGAIETVAGQATGAELAAKMANSIDSNRQLQETYTPHTALLVRMADHHGSAAAAG